MVALSDIETIILHPSVAGLIGSSISLILKGQTKINDKIVHILSGMACVFYFSPFFAEVLNITSNLGRPAFGFVAGLLGLDLIIKIVDWFRKADLAAVISVIKRGGL